MMSNRERIENTRAMVFVLIRLGLVDGVRIIGGDVYVWNGNQAAFVTTPNRDGSFNPESMLNPCREI